MGRPSNYKTRLCLNWQQHGECSFGDRCNFAHGSEQLRPRGNAAAAAADGGLASAEAGDIPRLLGPKITVHYVSNPGPQLPTVSDEELRHAWKTLGPVEAMSPLEAGGAVRPVKVFSSPNLFAAAVYDCFFKHLPLKISPDVVWTTITQGFAQYVLKHAEQLRHKFVNFQGKTKLTIRRPEFVKGSAHNDWPGVFPEFSEKIATYIGRQTQQLLENDFSTSSPTDKIVSNIVLMDAMQVYFEYEMLCGCGIPYIELLGTLADWESLLAKARALRPYSVTACGDEKKAVDAKTSQSSSQKDEGEGEGEGDVLEMWLNELVPVLEHFVLAAKGKADVTFWGSICNMRGASGMCGDPITGWIAAFFPYLENARRNYAMGQWRAGYEEAMLRGVDEVLAATTTVRDRWGGGIGFAHHLSDFPTGLASAPVNYVDEPTQESYPMAFYGGLTAIYQHPDGALEPRTGWAVIDAPPNPPA